MFYLKLLLYILYLFLYLHEAGQVTYLSKKQENIHPENGYKFRNGNGLFLLSACNTQRFSHANQTASERQSCPHRLIVTTIVTLDLTLDGFAVLSISTDDRGKASANSLKEVGYYFR